MAKRLYKVENDKKLLGVCGGLAEYFNTDPTIVRVAWAIFTVLSCGTAVIIYILCALIFPYKSDVTSAPEENKKEE